MSTYLLSFRLSSEVARWNALNEAVLLIAIGHSTWCETTSFYVFRSDHNPEELADYLASQCRLQTDETLLLINFDTRQRAVRGGVRNRAKLDGMFDTNSLSNVLAALSAL